MTIFLTQDTHSSYGGTPLAMLAAQCNKINTKLPSPLPENNFTKGFVPWKKSHPSSSPLQASSGFQLAAPSSRLPGPSVNLPLTMQHNGLSSGICYGGSASLGSSPPTGLSVSGNLAYTTNEHFLYPSPTTSQNDSLSQVRLYSLWRHKYEYHNSYFFALNLSEICTIILQSKILGLTVVQYSIA